MGGIVGPGEAKVAPLSHEQEELWLFHQLVPRAPVDNECVALTLPGPLDAGLLRQSLAAFAGRHEIWRTSFPRRNGRPVQVVAPEPRCGWAVIDLGELPAAEREAEALRRAEELVARPFDLTRGPLVRAALVRLGEREHRLFVAWHAIVADRPSLTQIFAPELRELYDAQVQGRAARLEPVSVQYADHAVRQRAEQADDEVRAGLAFWREYLAGAPTVLELPGDRPRPGQRSYRGEAEPFALGPELTAGVQELSRREGVAPRVTLTAAFQALLGRYTGQEDLLLGLTVPGPRPGTRAVGPFTSTVVLRAGLAGEPSGRELLTRTQAASEAALGHSGVPLDAIVQELRPERTLAHHPLVQVLLVFEPEPSALPDGWRLAVAPAHPGTAKFDLCLEVEERADGLTGRFVYSSDLFEADTIRRMIGHWRTLLAGMIAQPWLPVPRLPMLTGPETARLRQWSRGRELGDGPDITALIAAQARIRPDEVALACGARRLSYRQLNDQANRLARYLRARGTGPEVPVGVCLDRSADQIVALIAILRAGGAYVTLDPEAPAERIRHVVADTRMPLLLTQQRLRDMLATAGADLVSLDGDRAAIGRHSASEPEGHPAPGQLAYIFYTSGSTGRPKGVMVERGAMSAHSRAMLEEYRLGPSDRVLQFSQYSADASLEQILSALAAGARLVMRGTEIWSPRQLLAELTGQQVTVMNLFPGYWQQVLREWARVPAELARLRLRLVILGGERLTAQAVHQWRELGLPGVRLLNAYGPTETTITATLGDAGAEAGPVTIGRPLPGRTVHILDRAGQPVPAGVPGELYIGGPLLARGYLNLPAVTKERFVPDPFAGPPGGRLYRTGDIVRYRPDGRIEYMGRGDEQLKIRGYRIEPGEVEAVLRQHPAVAEAVVTAQGDDAEKELVAFVVGRAGGPVPRSQLREYLASQLPRHMQPAVIEEMAELPRLATGKPDRRRLPRVERAGRRDEVSYLPARLLEEQQLVEIWEELLAVRPIGVRDNFFHLGGHSLLAAQLADRIERATGKKLALSTLFAKPTVEQLARALREDEPDGRGARARLLPVQAEGSRVPFFFLHGDWTGGAFYCFALARAAGPEQPLYVIEPCAFSPRERVPTLEMIAAAHIEAMRTVQAHGPYRLGGFCNGGLLAYEMARQLEEDGEQIEFLGLIDPSPPVQPSLLRAACDQVQRLLRAPEARRADAYLRARHAQRHVYRRLRPRGARVQDFGKLLAIDPRLAAMFPPRDALYSDYVGVFTWTAASYRARIYRGRITFFWAQQEPWMARTWRPVITRKRAADVKEHPVPGRHMAVVTDHVQELAGALSECLAQAGQQDRPSPAPAAMTCQVRLLRGRDLRQVLAIERQAFPDDAWTASTAGGWLARCTRGGGARYATWLDRFIRFTRLHQAISLARMTGTVLLGRPPRGLSYIVAETDATVAGYACLHAAAGGEADIQMIAVRADRRGQNIGTQLLAELIAMAAARGCRGVFLYVRSSNTRARDLYRRTGFTETQVLPGFYQPSGTDAVVMRLPIPGPAVQPCFTTTRPVNTFPPSLT